jgi:hypothetical protein
MGINDINPNDTTRHPQLKTAGDYEVSVVSALAKKSTRDGSDIRIFELLVEETTADGVAKGSVVSKLFYPGKSDFAAQLLVNALASMWPEALPKDREALFNGDQLMRGLKARITVEDSMSKAGKPYSKVTFFKVKNQATADIKANRKRLDGMGL